LLDNGTVAGVNATSSTVSFNVQGSGTLNPFNVASSSGTSYLSVASNGSTTLSSLGTGPVYSASGSLYNNGTTGTGLTVQQTSPSLITPVLGVASGTSLSISGILWGNGQTNLTTASATALTVSGLTSLASTSITGTLTVTGSTTLSTLTAGLVRTTSGGSLYTDNTSYLTSAITSINAATGPAITLATGTSGNIFNLASTSNVFTFNLPFSSIANTGQLQASDFLTFNNKLSGSLTSGFLPRATGASTTTNSLVYDTGSNVGINTTTPLNTFTVVGAGVVNPFVIASSTGNTLLSVNTFGSTTIANLTAGLIKSTANGALFNGLASLSSDVTGILPIANGGTNSSTLGTTLVVIPM
jgi:hypothetical protein